MRFCSCCRVHVAYVCLCSCCRIRTDVKVDKLGLGPPSRLANSAPQESDADGSK